MSWFFRWWAAFPAECALCAQFTWSLGCACNSAFCGFHFFSLLLVGFCLGFSTAGPRPHRNACSSNILIKWSHYLPRSGELNSSKGFLWNFSLERLRRHVLFCTSLVSFLLHLLHLQSHGNVRVPLLVGKSQEDGWIFVMGESGFLCALWCGTKNQTSLFTDSEPNGNDHTSLTLLWSWYFRSAISHIDEFLYEIGWSTLVFVAVRLPMHTALSSFIIVSRCSVAYLAIPMNLWKRETWNSDIWTFALPLKNRKCLKCDLLQLLDSCIVQIRILYKVRSTKKQGLVLVLVQLLYRLLLSLDDNRSARSNVHHNFTPVEFTAHWHPRISTIRMF